MHLHPADKKGGMLAGGGAAGCRTGGMMGEVPGQFCSINRLSPEIIAAPTSLVDAFPPVSGVMMPASVVRRMASSIRAAPAISP